MIDTKPRSNIHFYLGEKRKAPKVSKSVSTKSCFHFSFSLIGDAYSFKLLLYNIHLFVQLTVSQLSFSSPPESLKQSKGFPFIPLSFLTPNLSHLSVLYTQSLNRHLLPRTSFPVSQSFQNIHCPLKYFLNPKI